MVEVPISPPVTVTAVEEPRGRCFVGSCCGCFTLATGIAILGFFDVLSGVGQLFTSVAVLVARTHEHAIDHALAKVMTNTTATVVKEKVAEVNYGIDMAATMLPFLLIVAVVTIAAGIYGLRASKGDVDASRKYYAWRLAQAVWGLVSLLFNFAGLGHALLAIYFAVVARSFWTKLTLEQEALPTTAPPTQQTPAVANGTVVFIGAPVN